MRAFLKLLFWGNFLIIFGFWFSSSSRLLGVDLASTCLALGRVFGLLTVYLVLVQLLLIGRIYFIESFFGHDKLAKVHHKVGKFIIGFLILHVFLVVFSYSQFAQITYIEQSIQFFTTNFDLTKAYLAFGLFGVVVVTSIWTKRLKLKYEIWYFIHFCVYMAILLAFGHQLQLGGDFINPIFQLYWLGLYAGVALLFLIFRFGRVVYFFLVNDFEVEKLVLESNDVTSIYIKTKKFLVNPGQFMIFRFLDNKRFWQAHPFSLSFVPKDNLIRISVKNSGDFTSEIGKIAPHTKVLIDGPLGTFTSKFATKDKFLMIAGGIGITPIRALIEELNSKGKDIVLFYSNKTSQDIVFEKELSSFKAKVYYFLTEEKSKNKYINKRIDKDDILKLAPDFAGRDIYICGPKGFMEQMISFLIELKVPENQIHFEKFSLH